MLPQTAREFVEFMQQVWSTDCEPAEDGGIILYQSDLNEHYHDATALVKQVATRTGTSRLDGKAAPVYRFPDGSRVIVTSDGTACRETYTRFAPRPNRNKGP